MIKMNGRLVANHMAGMIDYLTTQSRCVDVGARVGWEIVKGGLIVSVTIPGVRGRGEKVVTRDRTSRIACIAEDNIKMRHDVNKNACWRPEGRFQNGEEVWWEGRADAVAVFYSPAWEPGAIWEESNGNQYKDDYRRTCRVVNVEPNPAMPGTFLEIEVSLTEDNLRRLLTGKPLRVREWSRGRRERVAAE